MMEEIEVKVGNTYESSSNGLIGRKLPSSPQLSHSHSFPSNEGFSVEKGLSISRILRLIFADKDCKKLFLFVSLLSTITIIQISYGTYVGSLGLVSAAFHAVFDCISLVISLVAMVLSKQRPTPKFSFGYDRFEILSSFSNGVFLLFVSLFLLFESIERISEPEEMHIAESTTVLLVSCLGLAINILGVVFFWEARQKRDMRARDENIYTIFVHIALDAVASVGVICSTWFMSHGWLIADPLVAIGIICLIGYNALPICTRTAQVLLQTTPPLIQDQLEKALREASTFDGVLECKNQHFWTQSFNVYVGSLVVRIRNDANEQAILNKVRFLFSPLTTHLTVQIEKDN
eukprot:TRINITY_DN4580_c0_g1_i1.p1 TRINITY_DN4580_c0_g1~~TRINITY_DN4580_c0_g1_i1.p1  ORF type:complete len:347 (+),score=68.82 TRINITY_DN4580_c0_g1_i1:74-1114(+)